MAIDVTLANDDVVVTRVSTGRRDALDMSGADPSHPPAARPPGSPLPSTSDLEEVFAELDPQHIAILRPVLDAALASKDD